LGRDLSCWWNILVAVEYVGRVILAFIFLQAREIFAKRLPDAHHIFIVVHIVAVCPFLSVGR